MANDPSTTSSTPLPPELLAEVKGIIIGYLEWHRVATFVELAKLLRGKRAAGNIAISNSQIKVVIEQLVETNSIMRAGTEYSLPANENETVHNESNPLMVHINNFLDVIYDEQAKRARVLVDGKPFLHCSFVVADIPSTDRDIQSIDDLAQYQDARILEGDNVRKYLTPIEEVFAHASNLQAWAEHGYDTRLLHSNIAFPLLKELANAGDETAARAFKIELEERIDNGNAQSCEAILQICTNLILDEDILEMLWQRFNHNAAIRQFIIEMHSDSITDHISLHNLAQDPLNYIGVLKYFLHESCQDEKCRYQIEKYVNEFFPFIITNQKAELVGLVMEKSYNSMIMEVFLDNIPPENLEPIVDYLNGFKTSPEYDIFLELCHNVSLPYPLMKRLAKNPDPSIRAKIASRPDLTQDIVTDIVANSYNSENDDIENSEVDESFFDHGTTTTWLYMLHQTNPAFRSDGRFAWILERLSYSSDADIRLDVASQPELSDKENRDTAIRLANDPVPRVAKAAGANLERDAMLKYPMKGSIKFNDFDVSLAGFYNRLVWYFKFHKADSDFQTNERFRWIWELFSQSDNVDTRLEVAILPNLRQDIALRLARDADSRVAAAAQARLENLKKER